MPISRGVASSSALVLSVAALCVAVLTGLSMGVRRDGGAVADMMPDAQASVSAVARRQAGLADDVRMTLRHRGGRWDGHPGDPLVGTLRRWTAGTDLRLVVRTGREYLLGEGAGEDGSLGEALGRVMRSSKDAQGREPMLDVYLGTGTLVLSDRVDGAETVADRGPTDDGPEPMDVSPR